MNAKRCMTFIINRWKIKMVNEYQLNELGKNDKFDGWISGRLNSQTEKLKT